MKFAFFKQSNARIELVDSTKDGIQWWDWLIFIILAVFCYIFFAHQDIIATAEHAYCYTNGNVLDFYSACNRLNDQYSANYFPSTFMLFSIWDIPIALSDAAPVLWKSSTIVQIYWYKLLPIIFYFASGYVIYSLSHDCFGFSKKKARLTAYLFLTAPLAFFSQFIFAQYDIFAVFFMMLGCYFYFNPRESKKDYYLFILFFGIATTFKYFAITVFVVLLLLRYKKIKNIFISLLLVALPILAEYLFYKAFDGEAFTRAVGGFQATDFATYSGITVGYTTIKLMPWVVVALACAAYIMKPNNRNDLICKSMFLCCGIGFALFGLMNWYPQWLLFAVPFWVISTVINRRYKLFLVADLILFVVFLLLTVNVFNGAVDQTLFSGGLLRTDLQYAVQVSNLTMSDIFQYKDTNMLFTFLSAMLFICFWFKQPKYCFEDISQELDAEADSIAKAGTMPVVRVRLTAAVLLFVIPAFCCLPSYLEQPKQLWSPSRQNGDIYANCSGIQEISNIEQIVTIEGSEISQINILTNIYAVENEKTQLTITVIDDETGEKVGAETLAFSDITNDGESIFKFKKPISTKPGANYRVRLNTSVPTYMDPEPRAIISVKYLRDATPFQANSLLKDYSNQSLYIDGALIEDAALGMKILGEAKKSSY